MIQHIEAPTELFVLWFPWHFPATTCNKVFSSTVMSHGILKQQKSFTPDRTAARTIPLPSALPLPSKDAACRHHWSVLSEDILASVDRVEEAVGVPVLLPHLAQEHALIRELAAAVDVDRLFGREG